ncbi:hypothetical protein WCD74_22440 [Actinomycetospora sp. OC33-EN08]|uniref:Uncharacterized protein n=1 Tax=Actinomycetospora aurantiaca TaxID=3129233 RepID=A0ABU8MTB6_9PSEU
MRTCWQRSCAWTGTTTARSPPNLVVHGIETITHLAFYTGWPCAVTAAKQLRAILDGRTS